MRKRRFDTTEEVEELLRRLGSESLLVPDDVADRTAARIAPELSALRSRRREVLGKLALAGVLSFPLLFAANAGLAWLLWSALERFVPEAYALAATSAAGAVMLLLLSLAYGSLPILASFGLRLREETT
jgi:hypothetical protein